MPVTTRWTDDFLDAKRQATDPLADATLARIVESEGPDEARRLFELLIRQIEMPVDKLPPVVNEYLQATNRLPDWTDWQQVRQAHDLFLDHGPKFLIILYYKSLPLLYSCANGAQVLLRTSRLTHEDQSLRIFTRRIAETGQFLIDVMTAGNLQAGAAGIQSIQKVRLIHAAIRRFMPGGDWDAATLGQPINQEDMAVTLMTFSVALIDALEQFNIEEPTAKYESFLHTWTAIGQVLGVDTDLLPASLTEGRQLLQRILERQSAPSEAGKTLTAALLQFARNTMPSERIKDAPPALVRFLVGQERAQMLGIAPPAGCLSTLLPEALKAVFRLGERLEDRIDEPLGRFIDLLSRSAAKAMVNYFDQYKGRNFHIPEDMQQKWFA